MIHNTKYVTVDKTTGIAKPAKSMRTANLISCKLRDPCKTKKSRNIHRCIEKRRTRYGRKEVFATVVLLFYVKKVLYLLGF